MRLEVDLFGYLSRQDEIEQLKNELFNFKSELIKSRARERKYKAAYKRLKRNCKCNPVS